ncbi:MAG: hypothetical protein ACE5I9_08930 [Candidatus Methylomirabilales bacterium]
MIFFAIAISIVLATVLPLRAAEPSSEEKQPPEKVIEDEFLKLGTEKGIGGKDWMKFERQQIKFQIEQFIPPLLESAFTQNAFVLPPGAFRVAPSYRTLTIDGDDIFKDGDPNPAARNFSIERTFYDLDLFYGFDLNRKYLHSFTLRVNIPFRDNRTEGFNHPNGLTLIDLINEGSVQEIGDVGIFLKKKIVDQANFPVGVAMVGALFLPTGSNDEKFTNNGQITTRRPDPGTLDCAAPAVNTVLSLATLQAAPKRQCPFPFIGEPGGPRRADIPGGEVGTFFRFSNDGRLPADLQPGTGDFGFGVGLFFTRQFLPGDFLFSFEGALPESFKDLERWPGRSALHVGAFHRFNGEDDGIDPGDKTTFFTSFVKPIYRDYLAVDLTLLGFYQEKDEYAGTFFEPIPLDAAGNKLDSFENATSVIFREDPRPSFRGGTSLFLAPSVIIAVDPQIRLVVSGLFRVKDPELGPLPDTIFRLGLTMTF